MIKLVSLRAAKFKQLDDLALAFPDRGSILIQGLNEAGKSTLFESVFFALFGKGLVTEDNSGKMDDLIHYQSPRAFVKLAFSTDGASFTVGRQLNRGKPNTAVLDVAYANGKHETVTNLSAVNKRIVAELGLDGEALLNSCFVEQKKLEKLEAMNAQQRRDTLLRLLNLDKLSALEARYKPTNADEAQLRDLRDRLTLAQIQHDLPAAQVRLEAIESELRLIEGLRLRRQAAELRTSIVAEEQDQGRLNTLASQLAGVLDEVDRLKELRDVTRLAGETLLGIDQEQQDIARLAGELAALRTEAASLPQIEAEVIRLEKLAAELAEIVRREQVLAEHKRELQRLAEAAARVRRMRLSLDERQAALDRIDGELAEAQRMLVRAELAERQTRQVEGLRGWLQIREVALLAGEAERELGSLRQELFDLEQTVAERESEHQVKRRLAFGLAAGAAVSLALAVVLLVVGVWAGFAGVPAAALLTFAWSSARRQALVSNRALDAARSSATSIHTELNRREGAQDLAQRTNQDPRRLAEIEAELEALGLSVPETVEAAHTLAQDIEAGISELPIDVDVRQRLGALQGQRQAEAAEMSQVRSQIEREGNPDADRAELDRAAALEEAGILELRAALDSDVADVADARERAASARSARAAAADAQHKADQLGGTLAGRRERLADRQHDFERTWAGVRALRPDGCPPVEDCLAAWSQPLIDGAVNACRSLWRSAGEQLAGLDEPQTRRRASEISGQLAASHERAAAASRNIAAVEARLSTLDLPPAALDADDQTSPADEARLHEEQRQLVGRVASLRDRQCGLAQQLGLQAVDLDHAEAEQALARFEEQLAVGKQAYRIVSLARRNLVGKVLPSTVRNMRLLLPLLTNDRYRDVEITDDYKIRVWDDAARALKAKDIFSGGTRDQFSLALRLAFALATLPEELGAAPGFIFLDEPLSSFDAARTDALVNLLTRGVVASNFEQIFVISHNRAFDPELFDYHLQLDNGCIVSSDLPELPASGTTPQMNLPLSLPTAPSGADRSGRRAALLLGEA